jgi:hypothetical protein
MGRMLEAARQKGGNAVIGMRFDTSEMADTWTELCAYGTAVVAVPVTEAAKETARAMGYGAPGGSPATPEPVAAMPGAGAPAGYPPQGYPQQFNPQQPNPQQPNLQGPPPGYGPQQPGPHNAPPGYGPQGYPQQ